LCTDGGGFNWIFFGDNLTGTQNWVANRNLYFDDIVISTTPIGSVSASTPQQSGVNFSGASFGN
jgi:hypothetical protein